MAGRQSGVRLTPSEARQEFMARAGELWDEFNRWYRSHPEATFDEMEEEIGRQRRGVLGDLLTLILRQGDLGAKPEGVCCPECGASMKFKGYAPKRVQGLEVEVEIPRAYYYCPTCRVGFFPPGPEVRVEEGWLEREIGSRVSATGDHPTIF